MEPQRAQPDRPELLIAGQPAEDAAWSRSVRAALAEAPEPESAAGAAGDLLTAYFARDDAAPVHDEAASRKLAALLLALCGIAPFFVRFLQRHGDWLPRLLAEDLAQPRSHEELRRQLDAAFAEAAGESGDLVLRRFKYFELARITARDCNPDWVPLAESSVTLQEISQLADVLLDRALELALAQVRERHGPPRWRLAADGTAVALGFCVLGLGKLGAEELNYSSDVDLVYVHETPPGELAAVDARQDEGESSLARLEPADYFTRVAQGFGSLVSSSTADGFLYRVDLDLRPEGPQGTLVVSEEALAGYYEAWADTWEKAAFMKARPVAGDSRLGWRAIRRVSPSIYQTSMDIAGVESIRSLKRQVEETHGNHSAGFNVKIESGGIRDIEFIAQALLLLHGGRIPQIRERSTQAGLRALAAVGLLSAARVDELLDAYRFLRRVENRLQMEAERQVHHVPRAPQALARLARAMGFTSPDASERFQACLQEKRTIVLGPFATEIAAGGRERILELFTRNVPHLLALASTRSMIEELAGHFAVCLDASPDPERALNNLDRFIQSIGARRFYYELLLDRPELVPRLSALFAGSKYLSSYLASHPRLIEPVFADPNVLVLSKDELRADLAATLDQAGEAERDSVEYRLDALRLFQHKQVVNVGLLDIGGEIDRAQAEAALSEIAEVCLEGALEIAKHQLATRRAGVPAAARDGAYLVVGMGKLGSRELSYGSDLDLIFLFDVPAQDEADALEAQEYFVSLTQRLISALQTHTIEGSCYEIDARLRPSGNQGMLVTSLAAFERYHDGSAEVWERQALLRARALVGDARLAARFEALRLAILRRPLPATLAAEIDAIRQRMETELARETRSRHDFKLGRGGLLDVETVVQYLLLRHGGDHPELLETARLETQLEALRKRGLIPDESARTLSEGWDFLQRVAGRLRVVENRSISDLDEEHGDLDGLARRLGYAAGGRAGSDRRALLRDYQRHTEAIRKVYREILPAAHAAAETARS